MRRVALLGLLLALAGCGYKTWWNPPFGTGRNPNMPVGDSENLLRAKGDPVVVPPMTTEPGDIWPGPIKPPPTLQDLEQQGLTGGVEQPVPGSPLNRSTSPELPPALPPQLPQGSSTPPSAYHPRTPPTPTPTPGSPATASAPAQPSNGPAGQVLQLPAGPGNITGGSSGYQTMTLPGGGSAIVVPNGNGTSTVIKSDGTIETVPTPR
jgi:hypothetical protein